MNVALNRTSPYESKAMLGGAQSLLRNEAIQQARNVLVCTCGHQNISHGFDHASKNTPWPDGSRIGLGACGVDRDTRTTRTGWVGDICQCSGFSDSTR